MAFRDDTLKGVGPVLVGGPHSVHVRRFVAGLCEAGRDVVLVTNASEPLLSHERLRQQVHLSLRVGRPGGRAAQRMAHHRPLPPAAVGQ
ncbi:MAG: hypothetical protein ACKOD9_20095, partial [Rubrivivax sp.]